MSNDPKETKVNIDKIANAQKGKGKHSNNTTQIPRLITSLTEGTDLIGNEMFDLQSTQLKRNK